MPVFRVRQRKTQRRWEGLPREVAWKPTKYQGRKRGTEECRWSGPVFSKVESN